MIHVEQVTLYHITLPLVSPFETSFGRQAVRDAIVVELHSAAGSAWGECVAAEAPAYSYETNDSAWSVLGRYLIPALFSQPLHDLAGLHARWAWVRGHNMAKAALAGAAADLLAQAQGQALGAYLGGTRQRVPVGVSIGIQESPAKLVAVATDYVRQGYRRLKVKIKPGKDVRYLAAVRKEFPDMLLMADANSAYTLDDIDLLRHLDDFNLLMIEQPLDHDDIYEHSLLQRELQTSICLDESIHSLLHARAALALGSCRVINIKVGRVGGLLPAREIHDLCQAQGIPVWCGGMLETGIGRAANLAIASLPNFSLPGDISASSRYYAQDVATPTFELNDDSTITVPATPGLGVTVDRAALARVTRHSQAFRPE